MTMREFLEDKVNDLRLYPLVHALLNAPAVGEKSPEYKMYSRAGYIYSIDYKGTTNRKMYGSAPLRAFKHQLIKEYVGRPQPGEVGI